MVSASARLDRLVLSLYRGTRSVPAADYRRWALERLSESVPMDAAIWGDGYLTDRIVINSATLFNLPPEILASYEAVKEQDQMIGPLLCSPGKTLDLYDVVSREEFVASTIYREHSRRFGIEQLLGTFVLDPVTNLINGISIYRSDPEARFLPEEREFVERVIPHLIEAATQNYFQAILVEKSRYAGVMMVCDTGGTLLQMESKAAALLMQEWPGWTGPLLPEPLASQVGGKGETRYDGTTLSAILQPHGEHHRILLIEHGPLGRLSAREREVAEQLAAGRSYKEVSKAMGISPSTVTNHANRIYKKIGLRNKAELAALLASDGR